MKTIGTKLDNKDYEKLLEMCNNDGMCVSEKLRDLVRMSLDANEEGLEMEKEEKQEPQLIEIRDIPEDEPKPTATVVI